MDLDVGTRIKICQLIAGLITADAKLDSKEAAFVYRVMSAFGLDPSHRGSIVPIAAEQAAAEIQALARPAQDQTLQLLVEAAWVDGQVGAKEREYLRAVGAALAISDEDLERRIVGQRMA